MSSKISRLATTTSSSSSISSTTSSSSSSTTSSAISPKYGMTSLSYVGCAVIVVGFTTLLNGSSLTFEKHAVTALFILSSMIYSLHLVFGLYIYPSSFHHSGSNILPPSLKIHRSLMGLLVGTILFYMISIFYGAPITRSFFRTVAFSQLLSSMTAVPTTILLGCHPQAWKDTFFSPMHNSIYETCCTIIVVFSLVGAWVGGFVIPLDWDRPWQAWPISCTYGAIIGHCISLIICSIFTLKSNKKKNIM
ncbi:phosphatidylinositol glycan [Heterostelium album PN500]|uniref:Phosphatidylinositol glycan n=1 Tax=Heterostelium pallidum (strain ATCC 26659 / Pp 5 / PN500) TaxID=670386 RepID=D3BCD5_HETP5|nr:phosphatidylinositol glycan [Heterostelium album PN500]EFA80925.1 phosphatidylinositol glycan [Heterostelium album PN500]|eukprot:XP_020433043.1 phosphatidylinositol glycan [Heterostelium album PN500]